MSVEVVERKKVATICGDCKQVLTDDDIAKSEGCPKCQSKNIKKSLTIIRKAVGDENDDLESAEVTDSDDTDESDTDESDESDEDEEDDEDDEDDEDEDEEVDAAELEDAGVKKSDVSLLGAEALNIVTACAEDIVKVFKEGAKRSEYESVMVDFNNVMDAAAESWFKGINITKAADAAGHTALIRERVKGIIGKEEEMADTATKITKRDDLPEDVRKSLEAADRIVEENETRKWEDIAKGYKSFPGDKGELAKTLRSLSDASPEAFGSLKKTLDAAETQLSQSEVLKSWGRSGGNEDSTVTKVDQTKVQEIMKNENVTREQAEVRLMDGQHYTPTNA